jgi:hypothetical protein
MSDLPQHLETRRKHIRQQRNAEIAVALMKVCFGVVVVIVVVSLLYR